MKLIFQKQDAYVETEMDRAQLVMLGKRIYEMALDLTTAHIKIAFTEGDTVELSSHRDPNGHAPAPLTHFDKLKVPLPKPN